MSVKLFESEEHAKIYSQARPSYPIELVEKIIEFMKEKNVDSFDLAVDVGCGNGQATHLFSPYFKNTFGYDVSENQIKEAKKTSMDDKISFYVSPSEKLPLKNDSVSLVTVAAAIHWFNLDKFYAECNRILRPNGVLAIFAYFLPTVTNTSKPDLLSKKIEDFLKVLRPYFAKEIEIIEQRYKTVKPPFNEIQRDILFKNELKWKIEHLIKFLETLSGYQSFNIKNPGNNFIKSFRMDILEIVKDEVDAENIELTVNFEVFLLLCRKC
jgi:ubiquinone/menaquinone biosynthesis C-methylase UbiE